MLIRKDQTHAVRFEIRFDSDRAKDEGNRSVVLEDREPGVARQLRITDWSILEHHV